MSHASYTMQHKDSTSFLHGIPTYRKAHRQVVYWPCWTSVRRRTCMACRSVSIPPRLACLEVTRQNRRVKAEFKVEPLACGRPVHSQFQSVPLPLAIVGIPFIAFSAALFLLSSDLLLRFVPSPPFPLTSSLPSLETSYMRAGQAPKT